VSGSWRIARVAGIDVRVHATFLLIVAAGAARWAWSGWTGALFGVALTVAFFTCVVLHELGHSLVAKGFGISVRSIVLLPIGGVATMGQRPPTPLKEFLVSVAGPFVNVLIGLALFLAAPGLPAEWWKVDEHTAPSLPTFWALLLAGNAMLALFNLLPAFPMDGGRVFRAFLSSLTSLERATSAAVAVGFTFAAALFAAGLVFRLPTLPFLAIFVVSGAVLELQDVKLGALLERLRLGDEVNPHGPKVPADASLDDAVKELAAASGARVLAVHRDGRFVAAVTRDAVDRAARTRALAGPLEPLWRTDIPVLNAHDSVEDARTAMNAQDLAYVAVASEGAFLGVLTYDELPALARRAKKALRAMRKKPAA
jgi:Zn-dependent protease/CBS domain-containing protein